MKKKLVVGILPETKNIWERRTPLRPVDVAWLVRRNVPVEVASNPLRIYNDSLFRQAGAKIVTSFKKASLLIGIKEPQIDTLIPNAIYMVFSHTTKGQVHNRKVLKAFIKKKITLVDYEHIIDSAGRRLVYFGRFAGICGMIDTLHIFGERAVRNGIPNPFAILKSALHYGNLSKAKAALARVAATIKKDGFDDRLVPFVIGILGRGNVSQGAQEILEHVGAVKINPEDLIHSGDTSSFSRKKVYKIVFQGGQKLRSRKKKQFYLEEYRAYPERFESNIDTYLPSVNILVNASYWECRYPRILTETMICRLYRTEPDFRLSVIGDLGCDIEGTIEITKKATTPGEPAFIYDPVSCSVTDDISAPGIAVMATDNLPCEFPRESSAEFAKQIREYVYHIASCGGVDITGNHAISREIRDAVVTQGGRLTSRFRYLEDSA